MKHALNFRRLAAACRALGLLGILVFSFSLALAGDLPQPWRFWRYARAISLESTAQPRLVGVVPPLEVFAHAQPQLADLRIMDDQAREVPYVIFIRSGSASHQSRSARLLENSFTPGQFTQLIVDLGEKPPFHNSVTIATSETDFMIWAEAAVSDDARTQWRIVRERAGIYRLSKQGIGGSQTISYSDSNARYLRLRLFRGDKQFPVGGVDAAYDFTEPAERVAVPVALTLDPASPPGASTWRADLGTPNLPVADRCLEVAQPEFNRSVTVTASADGENWSVESIHQNYRVRQKDQVEESLCANFTEVQGMRYWRVSIENGNDPPLTGARVTLFTIPRHIIFRQEPGRSYRLLYGQSEAKPPLYELGRLAARPDIESAATGSLGSEEVNTAYVDPRPWTEQHPSVLWLALGVAVVLLGYSALRALRAAAP